MIANNNYFTGIWTSSPVRSLAIEDNIIGGNTVTSTTGEVRGIWQTGVVTGSIDINNNHLGNSEEGFVTFSAPTAASGPVTGIGNTNGALTAVLAIQGNDIQEIVNAVPAGASPHYYVRNLAGTLSQNISGNTFTNLDVSTTGNVRFIDNSGYLPIGGSMIASNNSIVTAYNKSGRQERSRCTTAQTLPARQWVRRKHAEQQLLQYHCGGRNAHCWLERHGG